MSESAGTSIDGAVNLDNLIMAYVSPRLLVKGRHDLSSAIGNARTSDIMRLAAGIIIGYTMPPVGACCSIAKYHPMPRDREAYNYYRNVATIQHLAILRSTYKPLHARHSAAAKELAYVYDVMYDRRTCGRWRQLSMDALLMLLGHRLPGSMYGHILDAIYDLYNSVPDEEHLDPHYIYYDKISDALLMATTNADSPTPCLVHAIVARPYIQKYMTPEWVVEAILKTSRDTEMLDTVRDQIKEGTMGLEEIDWDWDTIIETAASRSLDVLDALMRIMVLATDWDPAIVSDIIEDFRTEQPSRYAYIYTAPVLALLAGYSVHISDTPI